MRCSRQEAEPSRHALSVAKNEASTGLHALISVVSIHNYTLNCLPAAMLNLNKSPEL
jgi:hypothetical protein